MPLQRLCSDRSGRVPTVRATCETTAAQMKKNADVTGTSPRRSRVWQVSLKRFSETFEDFELGHIGSHESWQLSCESLCSFLSQLRALISTSRCLTGFILLQVTRQWLEGSSRAWRHGHNKTAQIPKSSAVLDGASKVFKGWMERAGQESSVIWGGIYASQWRAWRQWQMWKCQ